LAPQGHGVQEPDAEYLHFLSRRCPHVNVGLLEAKRLVGLDVFSSQMDRLRPHRPGHETLCRDHDHRLALMGLIPESTAWAAPYPAQLQVAIVSNVAHHVASLIQRTRDQAPWTTAPERHEQIPQGIFADR
jgi:hypothetical protein